MQQDLFDRYREPLTDEHLARVGGKIGEVILDFVRKVGVNNDFSMNELTDFVAKQHPIAPDSAGRILRALRKAGRLDYDVVSRRESKYRVTKI